jgi:aminoglycoside phosphotransferase (APT) family kinase protein
MAELTPVREAHRFDEAALAAYLAEHVDGFNGELTVRQFEGGQSNPTFLLAAGGREYVLRKQPPGELLPSAHQVDREHRVMAALAEQDVPVPRMFALCEDASVIGTKFYVMEKVEGRVLTEVLLPELSPAERGAIYRTSAARATTTPGRFRAGPSSTSPPKRMTSQPWTSSWPGCRKTRPRPMKRLSSTATTGSATC